MTLSEKFDLESFDNWIEEFLPDFSRDVRKVEVPSGFSDVKSVKTLGESSLGVRVFTIETLKDPSGRRVGLAKDSFNLIKNYGTPNALIAYYSESSDNWRFSLLTSTPAWSDGKIITKLSNPKRHSYVLGPNAKVNTPTRFLIKNGKALDFSDLKSRFSLEVVNKEFYKEISESFTKLVGGTRGEGRSKKTYESLLKLPSTNDHSQISIEFAVRLIGRVIFCWFLKEKISESGSSLMPKELLSLNAISDNSDYYHKILEPIFFEILNKPIKSRKDGFVSKSFSEIPYLNGGLFSPHDDDFFSYNEGKQAQFHNTVEVPDEWFKEFFAILETYNFTIDENTSIDEDLSIDPEMLGRIFENLLAEINPETGESARKSTGSYYTPRVIVDYMVDESLLLYLKQKTNIDEEKLRAIISYDLSDDSSYPLNEREKEELVDAVEKIKILDPACGSGAYPIGALQKIVFILQQTDPDGKIWFHKQIQNTSPELRRVMEREFSYKNFDYIRKLGIIRENIYGIDIQPIATEISRLRCFLTLVVDERIDDSLENRGVEPLPNLDFKFVTANSLIGLPTSDKKNQMGLFEDREGINELKEIRNMFFNAYGTEREQLKLQFVQVQNRMFQKLISENRRGHAELTQMLTTWDPFSHKTSPWFDPEWMFGIKEGFDLVIANPPYVRSRNLSEADRALFSERFRSAFRTFDIYLFFIEKSLEVLNQHGRISFIIPYPFLTQPYASKMRKMIIEENSIDEISDLSLIKIFDSAEVKNCLIFLKKDGGSKTPIRITHMNQIGISHLMDLEQKTFKENPETMFKLEYVGEAKKIAQKIEEDSIELRKIMYVSKGVEVYERGSGKTKDEFIYSENNGEYKPYLEAKEISRFVINWTGRFLDYQPNRHCSAKFPELFENEKILVKRIIGERGLSSVIDTNEFYVENTLICCLLKHKLYNIVEFSQEDIEYSKKIDIALILAILNSSLMSYYFKIKLGDKLQIYNSALESLPIKNLTVLEQNYSLTDAIIQDTRLIIGKYHQMNDSKSNLTFADSLKAEIMKLEKKINENIYKLYNLSSKEIAVIEAENKHEEK